MPITLRQAAGDFLAEQDESVGGQAYGRIANVILEFTQLLEADGVTDPTDLTLVRVEGYFRASKLDEPDVWFAVKSFVKWLGRRKYALCVGEEFAADEKRLHATLLSRERPK
jgi:hypothetical protein